jgi:hypothetical protein
LFFISIQKSLSTFFRQIRRDTRKFSFRELNAASVVLELFPFLRWHGLAPWPGWSVMLMSDDWAASQLF